jgi:hypothetical protein
MYVPASRTSFHDRTDLSVFGLIVVDAGAAVVVGTAVVVGEAVVDERFGVRKLVGKSVAVLYAVRSDGVRGEVDHKSDVEDCGVVV